MNRIYGKAEQPLAVTRPEPSALQAFARSLSLDEKLELLRRLQAGEFVATAPALPVVDAVSPSG
jgi:hypothetical protein